MIQRTYQMSDRKRAPRASRIRAWAVALGLASGLANQGLAQAPVSPTLADPPRPGVAVSVDAGTFPLPQVLPLRAGRSTPSSPQTSAPPVAGKPPDDPPLLDGAGNLTITPPPSPSRRTPLEASWENGLWFESA